MSVHGSVPSSPSLCDNRCSRQALLHDHGSGRGARPGRKVQAVAE